MIHRLLKGDTFMDDKIYVAIDLKSFYASVECVERKMNPLTTNLVVADESRTDKTICLAVSPSLKKYGLPGRVRLFEVKQKCKEIKASTGEEIEYIIATPRMKLYMEYSVRIYKIYMKYISHEDIHVYSIDEVFIELTKYLKLYRNKNGQYLSAHDLVVKILKDVFNETGITATAGIGTNMYLAKVAMDIVAKHTEADENGVRIAALDEMSYRKLLWEHKPLTDFWRIGRGIRKKLEANGMYTMGDVARMSVSNYIYGTGEDMLFKLFGIDAELLIDHAWGKESCTMQDIKNYKPESNSMSSGQVLSCSYDFDKARVVVREMVELQVLELVSKKLVTDSVVLAVGYDRELGDDKYKGEFVRDFYGRTVPKPVHGSHRVKEHTSSTEIILKSVLDIYDRIVDKALGIKRINISFGNLLEEEKAVKGKFVQMDLFTDYSKLEEEKIRNNKEKKIQQAMLEIQGRFGKNSILKGTSLTEGATAMERNRQIGGHRA